MPLISDDSFRKRQLTAKTDCKSATENLCMKRSTEISKSMSMFLVSGIVNWVLESFT